MGMRTYDISVKCNCGRALECCSTDYSMMNGHGFERIVVFPCESCVDNARQSGVDDGRQAAENEAQNIEYEG